MKAQVYITPKPGILDPQGLTVRKALNDMGMKAIDEVRVGKFIEIHLPGVSLEEAQSVTQAACTRLLANPHIEAYRFEIVDS